MVTTYTEDVRVGDVVKYEIPQGYCRKKLTIKQDAVATEKLIVGELLEDGTGEVVVATGGNCDAILLEEVALADLIAGDTTRVCLVRGPAIINSDMVNVASAQKTTALVALLALGIKAETGPTYTEGA